MAKIDTDSEKVFNLWLDLLVPPEISTKELEGLAHKSHLSIETLRKFKHRSRKSMSTETFIRLALSRGHSVNSLTSALFKVEKKSALDSSQIEWINYGFRLTSKKRVEFLDFIKYLRKTWNI